MEVILDGGRARLPGLVNAHSHAFHRVLRGLGETAAGDFWTWRSLMYQVADRLGPESYKALATCVFAEMALAGFTAVGEFHYLHHQPGGKPYDDPNEMSFALLEAAEAAGLRLCLLDACYLQASVEGAPLEGAQLRFSDGGGDTWSRRVQDAIDSGRFEGIHRLGAAIHSVRAVPPSAMGSVAALAATFGLPLHVHVSEQRAENEACLAALQKSPTDLLEEVGALTSSTTAVHATHLRPNEVTRYGLARCGICACPTTERDLGDGVGPFRELADSGAVLSLGSDSQAVIDPFEEARSLECHQRLEQERRGIMAPSELLAAATTGGARSLGYGEQELDDWTYVRLDGSLQLAGWAASAGDDLTARVLFGASPADVDEVVVAGRRIVEAGEHHLLGPRRAVAARLNAVVRELLDR